MPINPKRPRKTINVATAARQVTLGPNRDFYKVNDSKNA
jgi:hypothetical protein